MSHAPNVLVTGGAGFIGSHACRELARAGYRPVTLDNLSTGHRDAVRWGPMIEADVRNGATVERVLKEHEIGTVMHFAASAYVGESMSDPGKYYDNNVGGMIALLAACRARGVGRVVFSSSCATYGVPQELPIRESTPQVPINPYGRTKLICEKMLEDFGRAHGLRHVALRYFNACGADPEGDLFERHDPETHLIPLALMAASGRRPRLDIYGTDYPTSDGTCIRDYIHVCDLARGHVAALRYLDAGGGNLQVNLGSGRGLSILEVLGAIERHTGRPVPVRRQSRRPGDPPELYADPSKARRVLEFETRMSDIDTIIRDSAPGFGLTGRHAQYA